MQVQVSGKHVEVGEALGSRIVAELSDGIAKYFERGGDAEVVVSRDAHMFKVDTWVRLASGQVLVSEGRGGDAHAAFDEALAKIEKRVRRYKRRLKNHQASRVFSPEQEEIAAREVARMTVLRDPDSVEDDDFGEAGHADQAPPAAMVIAETEAPVRTLTVGQAVLELDLSAYPVLLFRNAAHGGLAVVYRRPDGNIGWIDPERTGSPKANGSGR